MGTSAGGRMLLDVVIPLAMHHEASLVIITGQQPVQLFFGASVPTRRGELEHCVVQEMLASKSKRSASSYASSCPLRGSAPLFPTAGTRSPLSKRVLARAQASSSPTQSHLFEDCPVCLPFISPFATTLFTPHVLAACGAIVAACRPLCGCDSLTCWHRESQTQTASL